MTSLTTSDNQLVVKTHIARDLLQNAALFQTDKKVVWEYVSNGLQYIDDGTNPIVRVRLDSKKRMIAIEDNGSGMDWNGLHNFFIMHGENIDRKQGRPGRGRFGTGKSAAFGIADILRLTTIRNKMLSKVELQKKDVESYIKKDPEEPIPVRCLIKEQPCNLPNGTLVEIEDIHLKTLDQAGIIKFIERNLTKWRNATVFVNNHECEIVEPPLAETREFKPNEEEKEKIGNVTLTIKIAAAPLDEEMRGIAIFANEVWHETTLAGNEGREMSQHIYGEIDVPLLDDDKSPISPFDLSRSLHLNPNNDLVQAIYAFIGHKVDIVRRDLVKKYKDMKASEEAKRFAKQAETIAKIINDDFNDFRDRVAKAKAKSAGSFDQRGQKNKGEDQDDLVFGSELPADIIEPSGGLGADGSGMPSEGKIPRTLKPLVSPPASSEANKIGRPASENAIRSKSRGGFHVEFRPMGIDEQRARYVREERIILINTDHPQLLAAKGTKSIDDPLFQKLSYEIAFAEYAIALSSELASRDQYMEISDPIIDIRDTINRIARKAAHLYSQ